MAMEIWLCDGEERRVLRDERKLFTFLTER